MIEALLTQFTVFLQEKRREDSRPREIGVYYASELGAECLRQSYYRYTVPKEIDEFTLGVFTIGELIHSWLEENFKACLQDVETEVEVPPYKTAGFEVHGRADMVVAERFVVDFKTVSPNAFRYGDLPHLSHLKQLNFYMRQLRIREGAILYVDKYALRLQAYSARYDPKLFKASIRQIRRLHRALTKKQLPPRHPSFPDKYPCSYCHYREECAK